MCREKVAMGEMEVTEEMEEMVELACH